MTNRLKFTPGVLDAVQSMTRDGLSREAIAAKLGTTVGSLQVTCSRHGISLCRNPLRRRSSPPIQPDLRLAIRLLQCIERDNLVAAVLDEKE
jgi:hypothetical protein